MKAGIFTLIGLLATTVSILHGQTVDIITTKDAVTNSLSPNTNFNGDALQVLHDDGESLYMASLVYFDISSIPSTATINSADFYLRNTFESGIVTIRIGRLASSPSWTETSVTYNNMPPAETTPNLKFFSVAANSWNAYDVTEFVQGWHTGIYVNNGFQLFTTSDPTIATFFPRESGSTTAPYLRVTYIQSPGIPTAVAAVTGSSEGEIYFSWTKPSGTVNGYLIVYDDDSNNPPWDPVQNGIPGSGSDIGNVTSKTISGLTPGQLYYLSVAAYNSAGLGDYANQVSATAKAGVVAKPGIPTAVAAVTGSSEGEIVFSWTKPSGTVNGYLIVYDEDSNNPPWDPVQNGIPGSGSDIGNVTSKTISGLTPGQLYYLSVAAYNSAGLGDYANQVSAVAKLSPLPAPSASAESGSAEGEIDLSWASVSGSDGYLIVYDEDSNNPPWDPVQNGIPGSGSDIGNVTSKTISGLTPGQLYYLSVAAYNSAGLGNYSNIVRAVAASVVGVTEISHGEIPQKFRLKQNYPNPFNPATSIEYELPEATLVNLSIFDVAGNAVAELVNEYQHQGIYKILWNASDNTSGMYFYRLQAGDFIETRKMVLLR